MTGRGVHTRARDARVLAMVLFECSVFARVVPNGRGRLCTEQPVGDGQRVLPDHVAQGLRVRISSLTKLQDQ